MLIPLALPPGVHRNGTEQQSIGRWRDAQLVRWSEGTMRPVGGWTRRMGASWGGGIPRASLAWRDLGGNRQFVVATHDGIRHVSSGNVVTNITPSGLTAGLASASFNTGFGGGFYGVGTYGTPRSPTAPETEATTWSLDLWGEELIACSVADGRIWRWDLNLSNNLVAVTNAPTDCLGAMVTDERFLFALGAGGNPRRVQWSDREDNTTWSPAATNEAGDVDLQTQGQIMCGLRVRGRALILTDHDAHAATYLGPPFVYGFERVGDACGVISRKAAVAVGADAYWMGARGFFALRGEVVPLACDVGDYVFGSLNRSQASKIWAVSNVEHGEVWWSYPSEGSTEIDRYVAYSYREGHWTTGALTRTTGIDRGVFTWPIWFDSAGVVWEHEKGWMHGGTMPYAETGPIVLDTAERVMMATGLYPDERTSGQVRVRFTGRTEPNDADRAFGPYTLTPRTSVRLTGRSVKMKVEALADEDWRVGLFRLEARPMGRR